LAALAKAAVSPARTEADNAFTGGLSISAMATPETSRQVTVCENWFKSSLDLSRIQKQPSEKKLDSQHILSVAIAVGWSMVLGNNEERRMDLELQGAKAIVTGGTRGIGRAIVEKLLAEGCSVSLCARNEAQVRAAVTDLSRGGGATVHGQAIDVRDGAALGAWVSDSAEKLGGIDIVVANASSMVMGASEESFRAAFEIDLMHTRNMIDAALPALQVSQRASVLAIASISGVQDFGFDEVAYGSLKAAILFYMKGLSTKLGRTGIRANVISPGPIYVPEGTWLEMESNNPEAFQGVIKRTALRRMGKPEEVAAAAAFLVSPAASFITGANLVVAGGHTRRIQN
jgi:NAD(P)-dependent dehydrogenase (short-subunit alcohol dehydrogenase family)